MSLRDVARATNVSTTTVSDALNGRGRLPAATRERVLRAAAELGYTPNAAARSLKSGRTGILAVTFPVGVDATAGVSDFDYFMNVVLGAVSATTERGYWLTLAPGPVAETFPDLALDGALVIDPVRDDPVLAQLRRHRLPSVVVGREFGDRDATPSVDTDHDAGTRAVLDHLAEQGAERIALVTGPPVNSYTHVARAAFERWCDEHGAHAAHVVEADGLTETAGMAAAHALLRGAEPPDAIFTLLDGLALGVLASLTGQGLAVPGDVLLATVHDSEPARTASPALTVLDIQPRAVGRAAAELLIDQVEGAEPAARTMTIASTLVPRASTVG